MYSEISKIAGDNSVLFILTMIGSVASFAAQILFGRLLSPSQYGILGSVQALLQVITIPFGVVQMATTAAYARNDLAPAGQGLMDRLLPWVYGFCGLLLVGSPWLISGARSMLHLQESAIVILAIATAAVSLFIGILRGICQGVQSFVWLGVSYIVEFTGRAVIGAALLLVHPAASMAMFGVLLAAAVTLAPLSWVAFHNRRRVALPVRWRMLMVLALAQSLVVGWTTAWDLIWVRVRFPSMAGYYTAATMATRIQVTLAGVFVATLFPKVERATAEGKRVIQKLIIHGGLLIGTSCAASVAMYALAPFGVPLLYGKAYLSSVIWFRQLAFCSLPLCWTLLAVQFDVAVRNWRRVGLLLVATVAYGGGLVFFAKSVTEVFVWMAAVWGTYLLVWLIFAAGARESAPARPIPQFKG